MPACLPADQLLGNSDRLPCDELGWRGNPENVMFAHSGRWSGRLVAIDAVVQRRPPGGLVSAEVGMPLGLDLALWSGCLELVASLRGRRLAAGSRVISSSKSCAVVLPAQDAACERLSELMLNDQGMAAAVLRDAVKTSDLALEAVDRPEVVMAFQQAR